MNQARAAKATFHRGDLVTVITDDVSGFRAVGVYQFLKEVKLKGIKSRAGFIEQSGIYSAELVIGALVDAGIMQEIITHELRIDDDDSDIIEIFKA